MVSIAKMGGGVWTLVAGAISRELSRCVLAYTFQSWRPKLYFSYPKVKSYLSFGIYVAGSRSLNYIYSKSDSFFGGRILGSGTLGFYSMAQHLSSVPTAKIVSLINNVSFPIFSRHKDNKEEFNDFFLKLTKMIAVIVFPFFVGGFITANQLIPVLLGAKWTQAIFPFKVFCISRILVAIATPVGFVNIAQGRPHWGLYIGVISAFFMPVSFYFAANFGLNALVLPWITIDPVLRISFVYVTLRKIDIPMVSYLRNIIHPVLGVCSMIIFFLIINYLSFDKFNSLVYGQKYYLFIVVGSGVVAYSGYMMLFQRSLLTALLNMRNER
jgi:O-antigen/teichoic acid export membrane protein